MKFGEFSRRSIGTGAFGTFRRASGGTPTPTPTLPGNITDLAAVATGNDVALSWTAATDAISHQYRINGAGSWTATDTNTGHTVEGLLYATEYDFEVRGVNGDGNGNASNVATETTEAAPGLTAPDVTVDSDPGNPPQVTIGLKADHFAGYFLRIQRNADGDTDIDGNYTDQTLEAASNGVLYFITGPDLAEGISNAKLEPVGYADPTGVYFQQYRIENEIDQVSPWVEIDGEVVVSVAVLSNTNGDNKSQFITISGTPPLIMNCDADVNAACSARTVTPTSGKWHFEVEIDAYNGSGGIIAGIADAAVVLGAVAFPKPGEGGNAGCSIRVGPSNSIVYRNGGEATTGVGFDPGDFIVFEGDTDTDVVDIWKHSGGSNTLVASITLTSLIPTTWTAFVGGFYSGDDATINFGATAFVKAPTTGYSIYG